MKSVRFVLIAILVMAFLSGCAPASEPVKIEPVEEASAVQPTPVPVPTHSPTPAPVQAPPTPIPSPTPTPTPEGMMMIADGFTLQPIPEDVKQRMQDKSYPDDCTVPYDDLRYLRVLHVGFDGEVHDGELVVNVQIAEDILHIMKALYEEKYPIEKMVLIDDYDANDEASMTDNNSSAFCYRVVKGTGTLSNHALGLAIDINPLYNPYVNGDRVEPEAARIHTDRSQDNPYYIHRDDLCYKLFTQYGFTWGGDWNGYKDYQHFDLRD